MDAFLFFKQSPQLQWISCKKGF